MSIESEKEPFLFIRKEDSIKDVKADPDDWDDTFLVRAYDKAVAKAKREIVRRLQKEMGLTDKEVDDLCGGSELPNIESKKKTKKTEKNAPQKEKWKVGSKCRAVYSEDGEEYEAVIIKIINRKTCCVRYYGYNNEEIINFRDLLPSHGKEAIKKQIEVSLLLEAGEYSEDELDNDEEEIHHSDEQPQPRIPHRPPFLDKSVPLPPNPPMPPSGAVSFNSLNNPLAGVPIPPLMGGDEVQNALLISWYMCGYYTGYYQRRIKDNLHPHQ